MGKKAKIGKSRRDKYYQLAKDTGYRSRAAFKLLQLNRKYEFLQNSRVCIDLCAAPGGWCQVASQQMPVSSIVIGIDLVPIKAIHNVTTFQEDITSQKCRQTLQKELSTWKADVVLHDGAPNVGKNWLFDAFQQASLTLKALKLATEFLKKGGWFVTKVFRSKDYNSLLWVFHQLFRKVFATKPQASRNESAEIFVVCQYYLAPDKLDPKMLDPKHVFSEVQEEPAAQNLFRREKEKPKAQGYPEGNYTMESKLPVTDYVNSENHWQLLANCTQINIDDSEIASHVETTDEIRELCTDIKVLGKPALKILDNWRKKMKRFLDSKKPETQESTPVPVVEEEMDTSDEEERDKKILSQIKDEQKKEVKKKRKKVMKEKRKLRDKMSLNMVIPGDKIDTQDDTEMFSLKKLKSLKDLKSAESSDMPEVEDDGNEDENVSANKGKKLLTSFGRHDDDDDDDSQDDSDDEAKSASDDDDYTDDDGNADDDDDNMSNESDEKAKNPLIVDLKLPAKDATNNWFSKDVFAGIDEDDDEFEIVPSKRSTVEESESDENSDDDDSDDEDVEPDATIELPQDVVISGEGTTSETTEPSKASKVVKLSPLELAIGEELVKSRKRRRELIEDSYHRYTYGDEQGLPDWFVEEERKHNHIERPVTKDQVDAYKAKKKAIDAAPIKKVAEATARKKHRMEKRLEKARKKAESVTDSVDISDKAKMKQVKEIYKKAGLLKSEKKNLTYVVGKKGVGKRVSRPPGVSGRFRVVDPRMKKDHRQRKNEQKGGKNKHKSGKGKPKGGKGKPKGGKSR